MRCAGTSLGLCLLALTVACASAERDAAPAPDERAQLDAGSDLAVTDAAQLWPDAGAEPSSTPGLLVIATHPDDDLLLMGAQLLEAATGETPLYALYLTAGNADFPCLEYAAQREQGLLRAYALLWQRPNVWRERTRRVAGHTLRELVLADAPVTLGFVGLRDTGARELELLWRGQAEEIATWELDTRRPRERYTRLELAELLRTLYDELAPSQLSINDASQLHPPFWPFDHADHIHGGLFALWALERASIHPRVRMHRAYNIQFEPPNLAPEQAALTWAAFEAYLQHDAKICSGLSTTICGVLTECDVPGAFYAVLAGREYPVSFVEGAGRLGLPDGSCLDYTKGALVSVPCARAGSLALSAGRVATPSGTCLSAQADRLVLAACTGSPAQAFRLSDTGQLRGPEASCVKHADGVLTLGTCAQEAAQLGFALLTQRDSSSSSSSAASSAATGPR